MLEEGATAGDDYGVCQAGFVHARAGREEIDMVDWKLVMMNPRSVAVSILRFAS